MPLSFATFASYGQGVGSCARSHLSESVGNILADIDFVRDPQAAVSEALKATGQMLSQGQKPKAKELAQLSQKGLSQAGVEFTVKKHLLGAPEIIIATTGEHLLNKMAAKIFEKDGTRLIYDADVVIDPYIIAAYTKEDKKIHLSHNVGLTGKPDASLFHEIKHWSITRKTTVGLEDAMDTYYRKMPWGISKIEYQSGMNQVLSFQERTTWLYETKLSLRPYRAQVTENIGTAFYISYELQNRIGNTLDIVTDVYRLARVMKDRVESKSPKIWLGDTNKTLELKIISLGSQFKISLPLSMKENLQTPESRKAQVLETLNEIIAQTEKDIENLEKALSLTTVLQQADREKAEIVFTEIDKLIQP